MAFGANLGKMTGQGWTIAMLILLEHFAATYSRTAIVNV